MTAAEADLYTREPPRAGLAGEGVPTAHWAIDVHAHAWTAGVDALVENRPEVAELVSAMAAALGPVSMAYNAELERETRTRLVDPAARLADMDAMGVALQVVSPSPTQYHYWADAALSERLVALQNDDLEALRAYRPDRIACLGALSLQHPELAERQLADLMARGFKGVEVSTFVGPRELCDPVFERVWAAAAEAGAVIFVHPLGTTLGRRLADSYLANTVGQPLETAVALSQLIFSGVLDRHPRLKILAAHGGGYLPGYIGRSDHAWAVRPEARRCSEKPSRYLKRIWFDDVVHSPKVLANLLDVAGASQVVRGSDYPFDMGQYQASSLLAAVPDLTHAQELAIGRENGMALLNLQE